MGQQRSDGAGALIHHTIAGSGAPPLVLVHGFGCSHTDWQAQVAHFSPRHKVVTVDLPGHGASPVPAGETPGIALFGREVARLLKELDLAPAVLAGHSMGCRVVLEVARLAPERVKAVALVDGSLFAPAAVAALEAGFAAGRYQATVAGMFEQMFTPQSAPAVVAAAARRAAALPEAVGRASLLSLARYDVEELDAALAGLSVPLLALQTTTTNDKRERRPMQAGQTTPYLDFLRAKVPAVGIAVIPGIGHFPQLDAPEETNRILADFIAQLP